MKLKIPCDEQKQAERLQERFEEFRDYSKLTYMEWYEKNRRRPDCGFKFDKKVGKWVFFCIIPPALKELVGFFLAWILPISAEVKEKLSKIVEEWKEKRESGFIRMDTTTKF